MTKKHQKSTKVAPPVIDDALPLDIDEVPPVEAHEDEPAPKRNGRKKKLTDEELDAPYQLVIEKGVAAKLSPKSPGTITYHVGADDAGELYIRIVANNSGGLFSKEWVSVKDIVALLKQQGDKTFKSSLFKQVIVGKSSNNASFLACVLRASDIGFITSSPKGTFLHERSDELEARFEELQQLAGSR